MIPLSGRAPTRSQPTPSTPDFIATDRALFTEVSVLLQQAAMTDEDHRHSGESDRLLRIASDVSRRAARAIEAKDLQNMAFDVAACINAARLVPGDAESAQRSGLLAEAATRLAEISETPMEKIVFPRTSVLAPPADMAMGREEQPWREFARQANHEAQQLARTLMQVSQAHAADDHAVVHGMAARIAQLSEIVFLAAALHGEDRGSRGTQSLCAMQRIFHGDIGHIEPSHSALE